MKTGFHTINLEEQRRISREKRKQVKWGEWILDADRLVLEYYYKGRHWYEIDLERCEDAAQILDWVLQLSGKVWIRDKPQLLLDLIVALEELTEYRLQGLVCPFGQYIPNGVDWKEVISLRQLAVDIDTD